jgi:hypothetical protein
VGESKFQPVRLFPYRLNWTKALGSMSDSQGNSKSPTDDSSLFEKWRQKTAWITGLGLSPEDAEKRAEIASLRRLESDWKTCEKRKHELLNNSEYYDGQM